MNFEEKVNNEFNRVVVGDICPDGVDNFEIGLRSMYKMCYGKLESVLSRTGEDLSRLGAQMAVARTNKNPVNVYLNGSGILQSRGPEIDRLAGEYCRIKDILRDYIVKKLRDQEDLEAKNKYVNMSGKEIWKKVVLEDGGCKSNPTQIIYLLKVLRQFAFVTNGNYSLKDNKGFYDKYLQKNYNFKKVKLKHYKDYISYMHSEAH